MTNKSHRLSRAIRLTLGGALGLVSGLTTLPGFAQTTPAGDPGLETVYVTGSRIARTSDFENPAPVVTFNKDDIAKSGYSNLQQLLEQQPFVGNGTFSTRGNNQDSTANGASSVSLRGLGADATLVLVNGRRVAISSFAQNITTNFVDINTMPVAAIERLEVLKDGASAVYGADAVAGVVNVILRKDFDGFEVSGGGGHGRRLRRVQRLRDLGLERRGLERHADPRLLQEQHAREQGARYFGTADQSARGGVDIRSSRGYPGRFIVTSPDATSRLARRHGSTRRARPSAIAGQTCVYDYGPWNLLHAGSRTHGPHAARPQGIRRRLEFFTEIAAQHNTSIAQGAPTPLDETREHDGADHASRTIRYPRAPTGDSTIGRYRTVDAGARQWNIQTDNLRACSACAAS